uniref:NADH-ubiquinone oxidoreductase chain 3 n=1 Tax=Argyroneta aquatica TaxID=375087 RepID=A0A6G7ISX6_ARGAQ|nr:NADH dehydrogenase subunit 3 [Argyroneta aquatica]
MIVHIILFIAFFIVGFVYFVFCLVFYKEMKGFEIMSSYECGFDPNSLTRLGFSYRFFLISILFLIFDVEVSLMLPVPFLISSFSSVWVFLLFILVLILGLLYEYYCGSLEW